jgi:hypothetical protein
VLAPERNTHRLGEIGGEPERQAPQRLGRCWMFKVVMTSMPAVSSSSTSCQRLAFRHPGTLA